MKKYVMKVKITRIPVAPSGSAWEGTNPVGEELADKNTPELAITKATYTD